MFFRLDSEGRPWFYHPVATSWHLFSIINMSSRAREAVEELWRDWYSFQPQNSRVASDMKHVAMVIRLVARDPDRFAYHKPNPDKTNWGEISHLVRYCIEMLVILRPLFINPDTKLETRITAALVYALLHIKGHCSEQWLRRRAQRRAGIEAARQHARSD
ncbi:hypothetical protein ACHAPU_005469 [Fusarium lateritium]